MLVPLRYSFIGVQPNALLRAVRTMFVTLAVHMHRPLLKPHKFHVIVARHLHILSLLTIPLLATTRCAARLLGMADTLLAIVN
jgi:hypothetical protein